MYSDVCVYQCIYTCLCLSIYIFTNFCLYRSWHTTCIYSTSLCVFMCIHTLSCVYVCIHTSLLPSVFTRLYVCECVHYVSRLVQLSPCWHGCECSCVRDTVSCVMSQWLQVIVSVHHTMHVSLCARVKSLLSAATCFYWFRNILICSRRKADNATKIKIQVLPFLKFTKVEMDHNIENIKI